MGSRPYPSETRLFPQPLQSCNKGLKKRWAFSPRHSRIRNKYEFFSKLFKPCPSVLLRFRLIYPAVGKGIFDDSDLYWTYSTCVCVARCRPELTLMGRSPAYVCLVEQPTLFKPPPQPELQAPDLFRPLLVDHCLLMERLFLAQHP